MNPSRLAATAAAVVLMFPPASLAAAEDPVQPEIRTTRLGEKAIMVSDGGMGTHVAVNSRAGIVVFDTGRCTGLATAFRRRIEEEFGRSDVAAVVLTNPRLDYVGGGQAYPGAEVIAHQRVREVLARQKEDLGVYLRPLIDMWRWKEEASRKRLSGHAAGSAEARREESWMNTCRRMSNDLGSDHGLVLPSRTFDDRMSLDLGDMMLVLEYLGAGSRGEAGMVARIPEIGLVVFGTLLFHDQHLLPYLNCEPWQELDISRTMGVLDGIIADEANIETVIVTSGRWPLEEIKARRRYMGDLWREVQAAIERGMSLSEMRQELTIDGRFAYVREWPVWARQGAEWCNEEHAANVARFWGQFRRFAAREVFRTCRDAGAEAALARYDEGLAGGDSAMIVDDRSFDTLAGRLFDEGFAGVSEAIAARNARRFPDSRLVHERLGEMLLLRGDHAAALDEFRRVLELDPQNAAARRRIEELEKS